MGKEKQPESKSKAEKTEKQKSRKKHRRTGNLGVKRPIASKREAECKHPA
jgi:hypothetical protein